ncbi:microtubule-associated proteins 1A/1B light chain 3C [Parasteatoda tepidariorum]|uniref:microtubule-associated proteins 1A/1B light chain 3C n=1 Tax=Parasteatoda tepidariorum TaxID=114398 RepID=UPI00077FD45A|nr:microtubule-associated proteins 1A/1B light chain 3C [Parasteatoda tepidariorum]
MFAIPQHTCTHCDHAKVKFSLPKIVNLTLRMPPKSDGQRKTFKDRRSLAMRKAESADIKIKFPRKVPVVVERSDEERLLPHLDRVKFLAPHDMTVSQFICRVRSRLDVKSTQTFYLMLKNHTVVSMSRTMAEVYCQYKDDDGFLYATYASQEMYG